MHHWQENHMQCVLTMHRSRVLADLGIRCEYEDFGEIAVDLGLAFYALFREEGKMLSICVSEESANKDDFLP